MAKDSVPVHKGRKVVAVATKKEAAKAADDLAKEQEAIKPPQVNPNEMPGAKPAKPVKKTRVTKVTKALKGLKVKRK